NTHTDARGFVSEALGNSAASGAGRPPRAGMVPAALRPPGWLLFAARAERKSLRSGSPASRSARRPEPRPAAGPMAGVLAAGILSTDEPGPRIQASSRRRAHLRGTTLAPFHRDPWCQGLVGTGHPLSPRTMGSMKNPMELAVSGMQTLQLQHRYRVKAKASYVDETLFGSPAGPRLPPPDFDPPWVEKVNRTKGLRSQRELLISHTPSYCDELLFGSRPKGTSWEAPWMAKGDAAKLHTLFWTPPATPRGSHSPRPRETPVRAIHPTGPSKTGPRVAADSRQLSVGELNASRPLRRGRSHSLTHLNGPSPGHPAPSAPHESGSRDARPSPSGVTFRNALVTPRLHPVSVSVSATPRRSGAAQKPRPPWK
ncbi:RBPJ-interacting and tubulin-associated protein 1, partial [Galemys pyrenaicus]